MRIKDKIARSLALKALAQSGGGTSGVVAQLANKIKTFVFTTTIASTTNIVFGGLVYDKLHDELEVFDLYSGGILAVGLNYTENVNGTSIDLVNWSLKISVMMKFILYKQIK